MPPRLLKRLAIEREGDTYTGLQGLSPSGRVPDLEEERKSNLEQKQKLAHTAKKR